MMQHIYYFSVNLQGKSRDFRPKWRTDIYVVDKFDVKKIKEVFGNDASIIFPTIEEIFKIFVKNDKYSIL